MPNHENPNFINPEDVPVVEKVDKASSPSSEVITETPWSQVRELGGVAMDIMQGGYTGDAPSNDRRVVQVGPGRYVRVKDMDAFYGRKADDTGETLNS